MIKISPKRYLQGFCIIVLILAIIKEIKPSVAFSKEQAVEANTVRQAKKISGLVVEKTSRRDKERKNTTDKLSEREFKPHKIYSVPGYDRCFPDANDVQLEAAMKYGVSPIADREEAERRKDELVFIGSNPCFVVEKASNSIPYLTPRASRMLQNIGSNFFDSLQVKGIPLHKVIVTSALRTQDDVNRLRSHNSNATSNSCHQYATTFDICYNRYVTVSPSDTEKRRTVANDTLKWVLSEVLNDLRQQEQCYVKYEKKQGCFHITVR